MQWSSIDWSDEAAEAGVYFHWNGEQSTPEWVVDPTPPAGEQSRSASGEEWWFGHTNVQVNGAVVGYAVAGYGSWANNFIQEVGCNAYGMEPPNLFELENWQRGVKGTTRGVVGFYDLKGHLLWYRSLLVGLLYNVIQTNDGDLVVVGTVDNNGKPGDIAEAVPLLYNGVAGEDLSDPDACDDHPGWFSRKGFMARLDLNGNLEWMSVYAQPSTSADGWGAYSVLQDVEEVVIGGTPELVAVGSAEADEPGNAQYGYITRCALSGLRIEDRLYPPTDAAWDGCDPDDLMTPASSSSNVRVGWFSAIGASPASDAFAVVGYFRSYDVVSQIFEMNHITLLHFDSGTDPLNEVVWAHFSGESDDEVHTAGGLSTALRQYTTGVGYDATGTRLIWPTIANMPEGGEGSVYEGNDIYQGAIGNLRVHAFDVSNGAHVWTTDLGEVRAYDLQSDMCATADGNVAIVCSKWAPGYTPDAPFDHEDLPPSALQCLVDDFGSAYPSIAVDWDGPTTNADYPRKQFNYWNTDAFVAKISSTDGSMLWCTQWDADPTSAFECAPGDLRNQECMYKITEAEDGGLVVSGNTSHNFDDYYLAKLQPDCQSNVAYDGIITAAVLASEDHSYVLTANEDWTTDKNIHGTIVVPDGITLTITNGAVIRFASSKLLDHPSRIIVEGGGRLAVNADAVLTSLPGCNGQQAMWDGIIVRGDRTKPQGDYTASHQGYANLRDCTVENALVAISVGQHLLATNSMAVAEQMSSGGIVHAASTKFINNQRDVVYSPYENYTGEWPNNWDVEANLGRFRNCGFTTTAALNDPTLAPVAHAVLFGVRGIQFEGCTFSGSGPYTIEGEYGPEASDQFLGIGIKSLNSTFIVEGYCTVPLNEGEPCPYEDLQHNTFNDLWYGITASTFGDMSRTFTVDVSDFDGCVKGIRMEGIQDPGITRCTFDVGDLVIGDLGATPYGLYSDQCTGYEIEENAFLNTREGQLKKVGLIIKDSGKDYNTFYNNAFDGLHVGSLIEGKNASGDDATGLEIKCNDYGLTAKCDFDVALTGEQVKIQKTQGQPMNLPTDDENPAGNRFSLDHDGSFDAEEDWMVEDNASTTAEYFHHSPTPGNRTMPEYRDLLNLNPNDQNVFWPGKEDACPSHLVKRSNGEKRAASVQEDGEYADSKEAYDAAKDNGDTYTLLNYVSDPAHSSAQVRNALQSVSPKVRAEVWNAAFDRDPPMSAWHIAQALLSNSPLQGEVLKRMNGSSLPSFYIGLVENAQTGGANILSLMESAVAYHAGQKADVLHELGRDAFTDSLDVAGAVDSLKWWHEELPAENHGLAVGGSLAAKGDMSGLYDMAYSYELAGDYPELYGLVKRYCAGWADADENARAWVSALAGQREVMGSAQANAWIEATGLPAVGEIVLLPLEERVMQSDRGAAIHAVEWPQEGELGVYPNPAKGTAYLVYSIPASEGQADLTIQDANGRIVYRGAPGTGSGIVELKMDGWASGLYVVELRAGNIEPVRTKLSVQR